MGKYRILDEIPVGSKGLNNLHSVQKVKFDLYQKCSKHKNFLQSYYFCIQIVPFRSARHFLKMMRNLSL